MNSFSNLVASLGSSKNIILQESFRQKVFLVEDILVSSRRALEVFENDAQKDRYLTFEKDVEKFHQKVQNQLAYLKMVLQEVEWKLPLVKALRGTSEEWRAYTMLEDLAVKLSNQHVRLSRFERGGSIEDLYSFFTKFWRSVRRFFVPDWTGWELEKEY